MPVSTMLLPAWCRATPVLAAVLAVVLLGACAGSPRAEDPAAAAPPASRAPAQERPPPPAADPLARGSTPSGDFLAARHAENTYDPELAARLFARTLESAPDNPALMRHTLHQMVAAGRLADAAKMARRYLRQRPDSVIAGLVLAVEDMRAGRFPSAAVRLRAMPARGLGSYFAPMALGWALAAQGKTDEALGAIAPLGKRAGLELFHDLHAGLILDVAGKPEKAAPYFEKLSADRAIGYLRVTQLAAAFHARRGDRERTRELYMRWLENDPGSVVIEAALARLDSGASAPRPVATAAQGMAESLFNLATLLHQEGVQEIALMLARMSLRMRPDFPMGRMLVADIFQATGRRTEAVAAYEAIDPDSPLSWTARLEAARNLDRLGRTEEALRRLDRMVAERPTRADALITKGDLLRFRKRYGEAVAAYDAAIDRLGELGKRHWSLLYSRGIALEREKRWARAERDFLKALEFRPDQPFVLNYLGYSWVEKGRHLERALRMIEKAVELRPNDGYIVDSLGWAHYQLGAFERAVTHLERAVELSPHDATINDHLGDAYWRVGRRLEARFQWRRALSLDPEPQDAKAIEAKLAHGLAEPPAKREAAGAAPGRRDG